MNNNSKLSSSSVDPVLIERLVAIHEKEFILRSQEIEVRKQANTYTHEFAKASLQATSEDRESERKHQTNIIKYRYFFGGLVLFLLAFLYLGALFFGKEQSIKEIIEIIMFGASLAFGGYAFGKKKIDP